MGQFVKKLGKRNIIGIFIIIIFVVSAKIMDHSMFLWARSLWWHALESPVVEYNGISINLPLRWSVIDSKDESFALFAAPDYRKGSGEIFLVRNDVFKKKFPYANPDDWPKRGKLLNTIDVERVGKNNKTIGGESVVGILYIGKDGNTYALYPINTKEISIIARSSPDFEERMLDDLFSRISFI